MEEGEADKFTSTSLAGGGGRSRQVYLDIIGGWRRVKQTSLPRHHWWVEEGEADKFPSTSLVGGGG